MKVSGNTSHRLGFNPELVMSDDAADLSHAYTDAFAPDQCTA